MIIKADWSTEDIAAVQEILDRRNDSQYLNEIRSKNLSWPWVLPSSDEIWDVHLQCMLTSQTRSGTTGPVQRTFADFVWGASPISLQAIEEKPNRLSYLKEFLAESGFRMWDKRANWIFTNFSNFVSNGECTLLSTCCNELLNARREANNFEAGFLLSKERTSIRNLMQGNNNNHKVCGFGPKQSRHFLKQIGLAVHSIPVDSRLLKFLGQYTQVDGNAYPWAVTDEGTFRMVEDWFRTLAQILNIRPVELDTILWEEYE